MRNEELLRFAVFAGHHIQSRVLLATGTPAAGLAATFCRGLTVARSKPTPLSNWTSWERRCRSSRLIERGMRGGVSDIHTINIPNTRPNHRRVEYESAPRSLPEENVLQ